MSFSKVRMRPRIDRETGHLRRIEMPEQTPTEDPNKKMIDADNQPSRERKPSWMKPKKDVPTDPPNDAEALSRAIGKTLTKAEHPQAMWSIYGT